MCIALVAFLLWWSICWSWDGSLVTVWRCAAESCARSTQDQHRALWHFGWVFEVTGQTLTQNLASVPDLDFGAQSVILPLERLQDDGNHGRFCREFWKPFATRVSGASKRQGTWRYCTWVAIEMSIFHLFSWRFEDHKAGLKTQAWKCVPRGSRRKNYRQGGVWWKLVTKGEWWKLMIVDD